jgi:hypothetical protein
MALGLVLTAIAAPVAQAQTSQSDVRHGGAEFPTWTVNWAEPATQAAPEFPTWQINWAQPSTEAPATPVSVPGFDYRDAGIGAAIALGAALLAAAGVLALRRNRRTASIA